MVHLQQRGRADCSVGNDDWWFAVVRIQWLVMLLNGGTPIVESEAWDSVPSESPGTLTPDCSLPAYLAIPSCDEYASP